MDSSKPAKKTRKSKISPAKWKQVEYAVRAGQMTWSEIARTFDLSINTLKSKAQRSGWQRDLTCDVKAATRRKLDRMDLGPNPTSDDIVEAASDRAVAAVDYHRESCVVQRQYIDALDACMSLVMPVAWRPTAEEVEEITRTMGVRGFMAPDKFVTIMERRVAVLERLVKVERQAFGVDDAPKDEAHQDLVDFLESRIDKEGDDD